MKKHWRSLPDSAHSVDRRGSQWVRETADERMERELNEAVTAYWRNRKGLTAREQVTV